MDTSYAKISEIISQAKPEGVFVASDFSHIAPINTLGKENIDKENLQRIRRTLSAEERIDLLEETRHTTAWIYEAIKKVCKQTE